MQYFNELSKKVNSKDIFEFEYELLDKKFIFKSHQNLFSKNRVDKGSEILIETVITGFDLINKDVMDLGCGYGPIGIILAKFFSDSRICMADTTSQAIEMTKKNIYKNKIKSDVNVIKSDLFQNINKDKKFDFIITNPPIRAGKDMLKKLFYQASQHLNKEGKIIFVIRKNHGLKSIREYLESIGFKTKIINKKSGYFIVVCEIGID